MYAARCAMRANQQRWCQCKVRMLYSQQLQRARGEEAAVALRETSPSVSFQNVLGVPSCSGQSHCLRQGNEGGRAGTEALIVVSYPTLGLEIRVRGDIGLNVVTGARTHPGHLRLRCGSTSCGNSRWWVHPHAGNEGRDSTVPEAAKEHVLLVFPNGANHGMVGHRLWQPQD